MMRRDEGTKRPGMQDRSAVIRMKNQDLFILQLHFRDFISQTFQPLALIYTVYLSTINTETQKI